jgi:hypothetical protein
MKNSNLSPKATIRPLSADENQNGLNRQTTALATRSVSSGKTVTWSPSVKDVGHRARLGPNVQQSEHLAVRAGRPVRRRGLLLVETELRKKIAENLIRRTVSNRSKSKSENEYAGKLDGCPQ